MPPPISDKTTLDAINRINAGKVAGTATVLEGLQSSVDLLERQNQQRLLQENDPSLLNEYTDSDVFRTVVGGINRGAGGVAEGLGYATGFEGLENFGEAVGARGDALLEQRDVDILGAIERSTPTGDILNPFNGEASLGTDPSAKGYGYQLLGILGEFAPQAATLMAKNPIVSLGLAALVGGSQAGNSQGKDAEQYVMQLDEAGMREGSQLYNDLRAEGTDHETAQREVASVAKGTSFAMGAFVGGVGGAATNYILKATGATTLAKVVGGNFVGKGGVAANVAAKTLLSGLEEGAQEALETIGSRAATNYTIGGERDISEGTFGDAVLGGSFGAAITTPGSAKELVKKAATNQLDKSLEKDKANEAQNVGIHLAVAEGDLDSLIAPENRSKYPIDKVAKVLTALANNSENTEEVRNNAASKLAKLETDLNAEITALKSPEVTPAEDITAVAELDQYIQETQSKIAQVDTKIASIGDTNPELVEQLVQAKAAVQQDLDTSIQQREKFTAQFEATPAQNEKRIGELEAQIASIAAVRGNSVDNIKSDSAAPSTPIDATRDAIINPASSSSEDLATLASSKELPEELREPVKELSRLKGIENKLREISTAPGNIFSGNKTTKQTPLDRQLSALGAAVQNNDIKSAEASIATLKRYATNHTDKATQAEAAYNAAVATGKQQALTYNKESKKWEVTPSKGYKFIEDVLARKGGGLAIHKGSKKLVDTIANEATLLDEMAKIFDNIIKNDAIISKPKAKVEPEIKPTPEPEPIVKEETPKAIDQWRKDIKVSTEGVPLQELVDWVIETGSTYEKSIIKKLAAHEAVKALPKVKLQTRELTNYQGTYVPGGTFEAEVRGDKNKKRRIRINPDIPSSDRNLRSVIIHEMVHAVTWNEVNKKNAFQGEILAISKELKDYLDSPESSTIQKGVRESFEYAISSPHELLTVALADDQLLLDLAKVKTKKEVSLAAKFYKVVSNHLKSILKLNTDEVTLLDRVLALTEQVLPEADSKKDEPVKKETPNKQKFSFEAIEQEDITGPMTETQLFKLNRVKAYFTNGGKTPISKYPNFVSNIISQAIDNVSVLESYVSGGRTRMEKLAGNIDTEAYFSEMLKHRDTWSDSIDKLFRAKTDRKQWDAPLGGFKDENGKIDPAIKDAISIATFDWITKNHNNLWFNSDPGAQRAILHLDDSEDIPLDQARAIFDKGSRQNTVINELGAAIYQAAGLRAKPSAPINEEALIKGALGSMGLGLLLDSEYVQRTELPDSLFNENSNDEFSKHYFIRSNKIPDASGKFEDNPKLAKLKEVAKGAQNIVPEIFGVKSTKVYPSLSPIKNKQKTARNSKSTITTEQQELLNKANSKKYFMNTDLLGENGIMHRMSRDLLEQMVGIVDEENTPIHVDNELAVRGKNDALRREIDSLMDDHVGTLLADDISRPFYIPHVVWKQFRVGQDSATLNPQNSKLHRAVTVMEGWDFEVNTKTGENVQTFQLAVLEAMGTSTDAGTPGKVVEAFPKLMEDELISPAIKALQRIQEHPSENLTPAEEAAIARAVSDRGENMHTFIGLVALAKYETAKTTGTGVFTSNLMREGDGKTNGPMIALMQMGLGNIDRFAQNARIAAMGGFFTKQSSFNDYGEYAEQTGLDLYKHIAKKAIRTMQGDLENNPHKGAAYALLDHVMGDLSINEKGEVSKDARKAVKNPITTTIFGSSKKSMIDSMGEGFIDNIINAIEKADGDTLRTTVLINTINRAIDTKIPDQDSYLNYSLSEQQRNELKFLMEDTLAGTIADTIEVEFAQLLETRKALNEGVGIAARMYTASYNLFKREIQIAGGVAPERFETLDRNIQELLDPNHSRKKLPRSYIPDLTREQQNILDIKLEKMFPAVHTYFSKRAKDLNSGIAGIKSQRSTTKNPAYRAEASFNDLRISNGEQVDTIKSLGYSSLEENLIEPGVGMPIMLIHSLDSYAAMAAYGNINAVNNHDAVTTGATSIADGAFRMNEAITRGLLNYSIPMELANTLERVTKEFNAINTDNKAFLKSKDEILGDNFNNYKSVDHAVKVIKGKAKVAEQNKNDFLKQIKVVDQYYVEEGKLEIASKSYKDSPVDIVLAAPPNPVHDYTAMEVLEALIASSPVSPSQGKRLKSLLEIVVNRVHGPLGASPSLIHSEAGETEAQLAARGVLEGKYAFTSKANNAGLLLTSAEMFLLEQVEITMQDALDGNSFADKEIVALFNEVKAKAKPSDFLSQDIYDFIFNINPQINEGKSDHLSRFVALGMVYPPLRKVMDYTPDSTKKRINLKKPGEALQTLFDEALQRTSDSLNKTDNTQKVATRLAATVQRLAHNEHKRRLELNRAPNRSMDQLENVGSEVSDAVRKVISGIARRPMFQENRVALIRGLSSITKDIADDQVLQTINALEDYRNDFFKNKPFGFFSNLVNEARGEQAETAQFYGMLTEANKIAQKRKLFIDNLSVEVLDQFNDSDMSETTRKQITEGIIRTDLNALLDIHNVADTFKLLTSKNKRDKRINTLRDQLASEQFSKEYTNASLELGYFMATGKNISPHLHMNAFSIAKLAGRSNMDKVSDEMVERVQPIINELVTLYAVQYSKPSTLVAMGQLVQDEAAGLEYVMRMHGALQKEALTNLFSDNPMQMVKGYAKEIYNPHNSVIIGKKTDRAEIESQGYEFVSDLESDAMDPQIRELGSNDANRAIYIMRGVGLAQYETGIIGNTGFRAKGSELHSVHSITNDANLGAWKAKRVSRILNGKQNSITRQRLYPADFDPSQVPVQAMLAPVVNELGHVANYRYLMQQSTKDTLMERDNRIETVLAGTAANQYDKKATTDLNRTTVQALHDFYREDYPNNPHAYVEISLRSPDERSREAYRLMPESMKREIKRVWEKDSMLIRNDLIDMVLGYRNITAADPFGKDVNSRNIAQSILVSWLTAMFGKAAAKRVRQAEDMWQATIKLVKDIVVIRNLSTQLANIVSNSSILFFSGVPWKKQISDGRKSIDGLLRYQDQMNELIRLTNKQKSLDPNSPRQAGLQNRIDDLNHSIKRNPVNNLVEAGMFQSILEDIDVETGDDYHKDNFNKVIDGVTGKLPEPVRKAGEFLTVGKNTVLYRMLSKSTQMGDFIARFTLYEHLKANNPDNLTEQEIITLVRERFVNYDVPTDRRLQYSNMMGLTMFTKYYIRTQKVIFRMMKEKPSRAMMLMLLNHYTQNIPNIMESSMIGRIGNNPLRDGAFELFDVADEPLPIKALLGLFD